MNKNIISIVTVISTLSLLNCNKELPDYKVITIDTEKSLKTTRFSDLSNKVFYFPLETNRNSLLGLIQRAKTSDRRLYILTGYNQEKIVVFDNQNGNYILTLDRNGAGPGEYIRATDFIVSDDDSTLEVYSRSLRKIIQYDINGQYISEFKWKNFVTSFAKMDGKYFFDNELPDNKRVITSFNEILLCESVLLELKNYSYGDFNSFSCFDSTISFCSSIIKDIYHFSSLDCNLVYQFDFLKESIPNEILSNDFFSVTEFHNELRRNTFAYNVFFFAESDNFIVARMHFKKKTGAAIYCKKTGNVKIFNSLKDDLNDIPFDFKFSSEFQLLALRDDRLLILVAPTLFFDSSNLPKSKYINNQYKIGIGDNPMILSLQLRNF